MKCYLMTMHSGGLNPVVQIVCSELMVRSDWMHVVLKELCVEKVVRFIVSELSDGVIGV